MNKINILDKIFTKDEEGSILMSNNALKTKFDNYAKWLNQQDTNLEFISECHSDIGIYRLFVTAKEFGGYRQTLVEIRSDEDFSLSVLGIEESIFMERSDIIIDGLEEESPLKQEWNNFLKQMEGKRKLLVKLENDVIEIRKEKKRKEEERKVNPFFRVVNQVSDKVLGKSSDIRIRIDDYRFKCITFICGTSSNYFFFEGDKFILFTIDSKNNVPPLKLDFDEVLFSSIVDQVLTSFIPTIIKDYESTYIKELPSNIEYVTKKINIDKITIDWLVNKFEEISEDIMNGETIENVSYGVDGKEIYFDINCHRYGFFRGSGYIKITDKGSVSVNLGDTPLEGCGIEGELKKAIEELIIE